MVVGGQGRREEGSNLVLIQWGRFICLTSSPEGYAYN